MIIEHQSLSIDMRLLTSARKYILIRIGICPECNLIIDNINKLNLCVKDIF